MRDLTFSLVWSFQFLLAASGGLSACTLPEGGSHVRCGDQVVCAEGLVCYRTFCVEPSQAADGSIGGGDDEQVLPDLDAQVFDASSRPDASQTIPPFTPDAGEDTDARSPSSDAGAPSDAGSTPDRPDAGVVQSDAQIAQPDAQVVQPDASITVDAGTPQDAGPMPCKGKKCCKRGEPKPCDDG